jgi:hypothetical protein
VESRALENWTAQWAPPANASHDADAEEIPGGNEHRVFILPDKSRVLKITNPPNFGAQGKLGSYLDNVVLNNLLWGDDLRLEGARLTENGWELLVSQPFIRGRDATTEEIVSFMEQHGFRQQAYHSFLHASGARIADGRSANIKVIDGADLLAPIDLHVLNAPAEWLELAWSPHFT